MGGSAKTYTQIARAKINLTLHVGQVQHDGYHPLHSLVVFADIGDELSAKPADEFSLQIDGPFAAMLSNSADNLVLKAAHSIANSMKCDARLAYNLTKNLPIASGLGGGSADAAMAIKLFMTQYGEAKPIIETKLETLGADIPVCRLSKTCIMEGVGEKLMPLSELGQIAAALINPGVAVSTAEIFTAFDHHGTSSVFELTGNTLLEMAKNGQNDLQDTAIKIQPVIQTVLNEIKAYDGCELARMSGSGATCFGLFGSMEQARFAVKTIKKRHPDWWCVSTLLGDIIEEAKP